MTNTLLVALREFRQHVTSRGFLLGAIGTPVILLAIWVFAGDFTMGQVEESPLQELEQAGAETVAIGYVDQADFIVKIPDGFPSDALLGYPDVDAAQAALDDGFIAAYYVVPSDYRHSGEIERVSRRFPTAPSDTSLFDWLLVRNLNPVATDAELRRLRAPLGGAGPVFVSVQGEGEEEEGQDGPMGETMLPFAVTIAVMLPLFTGGSYLFQSLTREKGSRVIEILLLSLRPRQLLTGKLLGLGALILVQYAIWVAVAAVTLAVTGQQPVQLLSGIHLSLGQLPLVLVYAFSGFALYAALMAGLGALAEDIESGRAWVFVLTLPMMAPVYLWMAIVNAPHGRLAVALSLFPYSAPVGMLMRMTVTTVPVWQLGVSLALVLAATMGTLRLMARLFRAQTLLSGESLSVRRFWTTLTSGHSSPHPLP